MMITIDGPVATGKSTIAQKVAKLLGFVYMDTGAMYRSLTYGIMKKGISIEDKASLEQLLKSFQFDFRLIKGEKHYFLDGEDITLAIRTPEVTAQVSKFPL